MNGADGRSDWESALELVIARTGHARYRDLCDDPDPATREAYRALVVSLATGLPPAPPAPSPEDLALRAYVARRGGCCG